MEKLYIIKAGTTFPATKKQFGDFDQWTVKTLGSVDIPIRVVDAYKGVALPDVEECAGVIITGSHAMVTDNNSWSVKLEKWVLLLLKEKIPVFGICYGHQLLARVAGSLVDFHPHGKEIGTVRIQLLPACSGDPIFQTFSKSFLAHVTHSQTVLSLPKTAVCLAENMHEPNHVFRIGECAWGVQFHPEYNIDIMRSYIQEQKNELKCDGLDITRLLSGIEETPVASQIRKRFGSFVVDRHFREY